MHEPWQACSQALPSRSLRCRLRRRTRSGSACSRSARRCRYFVAIEKGYFKEQNIEIEMIRLIGGPPNVAAMIGNQIDASAVLVTIEGMNANIKKPGVAMYISINSQNQNYQMEQFVVRKGLEVKSLADLKGKKIMSAPGPGQRHDGEGGARAAGLKEGDYTHRPARHGPARQRDDGRHVRRRLHARAERIDHARRTASPPRSRPA